MIYWVGLVEWVGEVALAVARGLFDGGSVRKGPTEFEFVFLSLTVLACFVVVVALAI